MIMSQQSPQSESWSGLYCDHFTGIVTCQTVKTCNENSSDGLEICVERQDRAMLAAALQVQKILREGL